MHNFVISVATGYEKRRVHIADEFQKKQINFEFFDAVTPQYNHDTAQLCGIDLSKAYGISNVEISCFLSHIKLWKKIIDENLSMVGVFEDDIFLGEGAGSFLNDYAWIPENIHVVKLEKAFQKNIRSTMFAVKNIHGRRLYRLKSENYGTAGYIISNSGAKFLLERFRALDSFQAVDMEMFGKLLHLNEYLVLQVIPALCIQDFILNGNFNNFPSVLEQERQKRWAQEESGTKKIRLKFLRRVKREFNKPFLKVFRFIYSVFFVKDVFFK